ncbi:MAG: hypothetical protein QM786_14870 [Breznakibacter sp.]
MNFAKVEVYLMKIDITSSVKIDPVFTANVGHCYDASNLKKLNCQKLDKPIKWQDKNNEKSNKRRRNQ